MYRIETVIRSPGPSLTMWLHAILSALPPSSCSRRRRTLAPLAADIFLARGDARALTPAAWAAFLGFFALLPQGPDRLLLSGLGLIAGLCLISLFDARYFVIPDGPLAFVFAIAPLAWPVYDLQEVLLRLTASAAGYATLRFITHGYEALRGQAGVGEGDARLFAAAGLWLGLPGLPGCFVYATLSALVSAVISIRLGALSDSREPLPFGPHLALGLWLSFTIGPLEFG
jgi:leader peptidase (prepilin peptidase) / N-methyltransferase